MENVTRDTTSIRNCQIKIVETKTTLTEMKNSADGWDFPGGPVAKTLHSQCRGPGFNPWSGN